MSSGLTGGEWSLSSRTSRGAAGIVANRLLHKTDTGMNGQLGVQFLWPLGSEVAFASACLSQHKA